MVPAVAMALPPLIENALPELMLMGAAVVLFLKPVILTAFEETEAKMGTPNLEVKLKGSGVVAPLVMVGNQSTPQPARIKTSAIRQRVLNSVFFISPVPNADSAKLRGVKPITTGHV